MSNKAQKILFANVEFQVSFIFSIRFNFNNAQFHTLVGYEIFVLKVRYSCFIFFDLELKSNKKAESISCRSYFAIVYMS